MWHRCQVSTHIHMCVCMCVGAFHLRPSNNCSVHFDATSSHRSLTSLCPAYCRSGMEERMNFVDFVPANSHGDVPASQHVPTIPPNVLIPPPASHCIRVTTSKACFPSSIKATETPALAETCDANEHHLECQACELISMARK